MTTTSDSQASESAFSSLRMTIREITANFHKWAAKDITSVHEQRMRQRIADYFDFRAEIYLSVASRHFSSTDPRSIVGVENALNKSFDKLNLHRVRGLSSLSSILDWFRIDMEDFFNFALFPTFRGDIDSKKIDQSRRDLIDLQYSLQKEVSQAAFDEDMSHANEVLASALNSQEQMERALAEARELTATVNQLKAESDLKSREISEYREQLLSNAHLVEESARISRVAVEEAREARESLEAVQAQEQFLNEAESTAQLVSHFEGYSSGHKTSAKKFFWSGIIIAVLTSAFAVAHALWIPAADKEVAQTIGGLAWKLAVVGGGTAVSTYLLRLSSYHRKLSIWSSTVTVQLKTFAPYIQVITDNAAIDKLRADFARRVFGDEPGNRTDPNSEATSDVTTISALSTLISNVAKIQGSSGGSSAQATPRP